MSLKHITGFLSPFSSIRCSFCNPCVYFQTAPTLTHHCCLQSDFSLSSSSLSRPHFLHTYTHTLAYAHKLTMLTTVSKDLLFTV